jgi:osmotically inducible lipoprotein OsmB
LHYGRRKMMRTTSKALVAALAIATLAGCGSMGRQDRNTAVGAAGGAVAGNVLSGGSTLGTVGGAVAGGAVGHEWDRIRK